MSTGRPPARSAVVALFLGGAVASLAHACNTDSPFGVVSYGGGEGNDSGVAPRDAGQDANPFAEYQCLPSESSATWTTPDFVQGYAADIDGITCRHPDVHPDCHDGWCRIPAGCFVMGSPESEWARGPYSEKEVSSTLTHPFLIQQYETTRAQWLALGLKLPPSRGARGTGDCDAPECPAASLSWVEAAAYANLLSRNDGYPACYVLEACSGEIGIDYQCQTIGQTTPSLYQCEGYRLPTEAEWEYAARAGTRTPFYSGTITPQDRFITACCQENALDLVAWYCDNAHGWTHPVGLKLPNAWGLFDILGNASEHTNDPYFPETPRGPIVDFRGVIVPNANAISKGGRSVIWPGALRASADASYWNRNEKGIGLNNGFRLVRGLPAQDGGT